MFRLLINALFRLLGEQRLHAELRGRGAEPIPGATLTMPLSETGYEATQPPVGVIESREIRDCTPYIQERWPRVQADFKAQTGRDLFLTCTWRSAERQQELYAQGRTAPGPKVTTLDGVTKRSRHNFYPAQAFDVCVDSDPGPGKHPVWDGAAYAPLGAICAAHGLVWGGDWNGNGLPDEKFIDAPHIEQPAGVA